MNNEDTVARRKRESRATHSKMRGGGGIKARQPSEPRVVPSCLSERKRGVQPPSRHSRVVCSRRLYQLFRYFRWERYLMGVSPSSLHSFFDNSFFCSPLRETALQVLYVSRKSSRLCRLPGRGWWWERRQRRRGRRLRGAECDNIFGNEQLLNSFGRLSDSMRCRLRHDIVCIYIMHIVNAPRSKERRGECYRDEMRALWRRYGYRDEYRYLNGLTKLRVLINAGWTLCSLCFHS